MITTRAGEYAAEWTVQSMSPVQRSMIRAAPVWLRRRLLLRLARGLVRDSYQRKPRDLAAPARHGQRRCPRLDLLHGPRAGAASALRLLCGRVHAAARAVQSPRARRSRRLPRHRQADLRAQYRAGRRAQPTGGAASSAARSWRRSARSPGWRAMRGIAALPATPATRSAGPHPRDAVREREARRDHLLARRSVGGAAEPTISTRSVSARSRVRSGSRRSSGCRCRPRPCSPTRR